jgi:hypothetical protein
VSRMSLSHLHQRERASDICVKHKHLIRIASQNLVTKVVETSCCAKGLIFAEVSKGERDTETEGSLDKSPLHLFSFYKRSS